MNNVKNTKDDLLEQVTELMKFNGQLLLLLDPWLNEFDMDKMSMDQFLRFAGFAVKITQLSCEQLALVERIQKSNAKGY